MDMNYCMQCGARLTEKYHEGEGRMIPWCPACGAFRYPGFNTAVSMIVLNRARDRVLLIRQYHKPFYVLVAGYVNQGEDAEDAVVREVQEEMGLRVETLRFNHSRYFAPTNTLMLNFTVTVADETPHANWEVDDWSWFGVEEAQERIKPGSLARAFLLGYFAGGQYTFPHITGGTV